MAPSKAASVGAGGTAVGDLLSEDDLSDGGKDRAECLADAIGARQSSLLGRVPAGLRRLLAAFQPKDQEVHI